MKFKVGDKVRINRNLGIYIYTRYARWILMNGIVISKEEYSKNNIL
jgi:hypothetical protein